MFSNRWEDGDKRQDLKVEDYRFKNKKEISLVHTKTCKPHLKRQTFSTVPQSFSSTMKHDECTGCEDGMEKGGEMCNRCKLRL